MSLLLALQTGAFTLTADAGAYVLSGQTANLKADRILSVDAGAYSLAGQDVGLKAGRVLAADAGSYVLLGQNADLVFVAANQPTFKGWHPYRAPYIKGLFYFLRYKLRI
jgi:hypothetical protein